MFVSSMYLNRCFPYPDVYFLSNMKVIDEVTATYLSDLTGVVKWGSNNVNILVKTWPFISIKNIRDSSKSTTKCSSCTETNAKQTAIFYGQPYQRETLQGCKPNSSIPSDMDKVSWYSHWLRYCWFFFLISIYLFCFCFLFFRLWIYVEIALEK